MNIYLWLKAGNGLLGILGIGMAVVGTTAPTESVWLKLCLGLLGLIAALMAVIFGAFIVHISNHGKDFVAQANCNLHVEYIKKELAQIEPVSKKVDKIMQHFNIKCEELKNAGSEGTF